MALRRSFYCLNQTERLASECKRVPVPVDSDEEDEDLAGSGGTYRDFVREMLPKMPAHGMTSQESMRAVGAAWRKQRHGGGLMPAGQHGSGHCYGPLQGQNVAHSPF